MFLEIKNTDIGYSQPLIKTVNGGLERGSVTLLIGDNGVGKTTLIKSILNQIPLFKGEITVDGISHHQLSAQQLAEKIAVVFSKASVPDHYTVFDLVSLGKYIYYPYYFKLNDADIQDVETIIINLALNDYRDTPLKNLSDGNLQKAFIGRALAQNSPMIILDEPTTNLDETNKLLILKLLRQLAEEQDKIILFSSHDWRLAKEFSDHIWYVKKGNLQAGIAEDILISNPELSKPQLFNLHEGFMTPQILAPQFERELLFSLLQKNFKKDLSHYNFELKDDVWTVTRDNYHEKASTFAELSVLLQNLH